MARKSVDIEVDEDDTADKNERVFVYVRHPLGAGREDDCVVGWGPTRKKALADVESSLVAMLDAVRTQKEDE